MKKQVIVEIPEDGHTHTQQEVVGNGKVFIVEVRPKLKETTPSWLILALLVDGFAGLAYLAAYLPPTSVPPGEAKYMFVTIILIAAVLIVAIVKKGRVEQVTAP